MKAKKAPAAAQADPKKKGQQKGKDGKTEEKKEKPVPAHMKGFSKGERDLYREVDRIKNERSEKEREEFERT